MPETTDVTSRPTTIGSICNPDSVADVPFTYCRYVGRNVSAPSIANPTMNASDTVTLNTDEVNNRNGSTGSVALCSTNTKMPSATNDATTMPMMVAEPHGYSVPPHDSASVSPAEPSETNRMPR